MRSSVKLAPKKRVVLCHGVFDLLHLGHIRHLQQARALGDTLVVSVTADRFVGKGVGRPHFKAEQRVEALKALDCVDDAFVTDAPNAVETIRRIQPALYVKGTDYLGTKDDNLDAEVAAAEEFGGEFCLTTTDKWSSSRLINAELFPAETQAYLEGARNSGFLDKIFSAFERADKLKVAFVGESITDEYFYVDSLPGKPSKEFTLATVVSDSDSFEGGVLAAAKHADWRMGVTLTAECAVTKTRFVSRDFNRKLFEVYDRRSLDLFEAERAKFRHDLFTTVRDNDAVVVFDFGHGLMGPEERDIVAGAKFLAVNAQTNAANHGFNLITKYPKSDYVSIDEPECRLATGMQEGDIGDVINRVVELVETKNIAVTRGKNGCSIHGGIHIPAVADRAVDTMGAGDAFLAVSAPLIAAGLEAEPAAFVGNVAGAIKVGIVGHQRHVGREELLQTVKALLS